MMPVSPPSRSDQFFSLLSPLNFHVGNEAKALPALKVLPDQGFDLLFAKQISFRGCGKEGDRTRSMQRLRPHPLDAIESFLEYIVRSGHKVVLAPEPQLVAGAIAAAT